MVIRLVEYKWTNEDETGLDNPHVIATYTEENFDKLIIFVKELKGRGVRVGDKWYTIDDYIFNFPESHENFACLDIYCFQGYEQY